MPKTLLLADDSLTIQKVVGICLANEDISIVSVDNGEDAVIKARALKPDLVIADVVMPRKNGYDVCLSVRQDPELKHIPVILLAGAFEAFDEKRYREVMANSYIIKPFESQTLIGTVRKLLYPEQAQAAVPQPLRPPSVPPIPAAAPPAPVRPQSVPPMAAPHPATPEVPIPPAPPHVTPGPAVRPPSSPMRPVMPPQPQAAPPPAAQRPPSSPMQPAMPQFATPGAPVPQTPAIRVPSFESALGPSPTPPPPAPPPEVQKPVSAELPVADEISTEDIEEIATSGVMDAETLEAPKAEAPAAASVPPGWAGIEIRQAEPAPPPAPAPVVEESAPAKPMGMEEWGLELKQELAEASAPPQILTAAESAQEIPFAPERTAGAPLPIEIPEPAVEMPAPSGVEGKAPPMQPMAAAEMQEMVKKSIREIVERVAWEVVPELAETIIREELKRLLAEEEKK